MSLFSVFLSCHLLYIAASIDDRIESAFIEWIARFERNYVSESEYNERLQIFTENFKYINSVNNQQMHYSLGVNQFADRNKSEYLTQLLPPSSSHKLLAEVQDLPSYTPPISISDLPESIDWTNISGTNYVTPVQNQGNCGSSPYFSALGAIESQYAITNGVEHLHPLSVQQQIDCTKAFGNDGCEGGEMRNTFNYTMYKGGLCLESDYPYIGKDGVCQISTYCPSANDLYDPIEGYGRVRANDMTALMKAVAVGPVSVVIDASSSDFELYSGGVLDSNDCGNQARPEPNHPVLLVGYGVDVDSDLKYWKIKNWYGTQWGIDGYALLCRDCGFKHGECDILSYPPIYPRPDKL